MQLRSRAIGVGATFYPFKRLPIELRYMIWQLTLEPRVVEVQQKSTWKEDIKTLSSTEVATLEVNESAFEVFKNRIRYTSMSSKPTMFFICSLVCKDAYNALLPMYPRCFASETHGPEIRFNMSLDTLYVDYPFDEGFFRFLKSLSHKEIVRLQRLAISETAGHILGEDCFGDAYWTKLGPWIEKLIGLNEILTVMDVCVPLYCQAQYLGEELDYPSPHPVPSAQERQKIEEELARFDRVVEEIDDEFLSTQTYMEIFEEFPADLVRRLQYREQDIPKPWSDRIFDEWTSRTRPVFGWPRPRQLK